jgi:hypothetical protein
MLDCILEEPELKIQEGIVVYKRQVVWVLILFVSKASPGASHQYFLTFLLNRYLYVKIDCALSL